MIVAGERQYAAMPRGAGRIGVLQRVRRTVDAGAFAVPDAEHAIDLGAREQADLLATPDCRRGKVLIEPWDESDILRLQKRFRAPQRVVIHPERRAAIAGDETRSIEPGLAVAFALQHRKPDQRLDAGQIDTLGLDAIFVVEPDLQQRHPCVLPEIFSFLAPWRSPSVKSMRRQCQYRPGQVQASKRAWVLPAISFQSRAAAMASENAKRAREGAALSV
jgi:hypothetical protein